MTSPIPDKWVVRWGTIREYPPLHSSKKGYRKFAGLIVSNETKLLQNVNKQPLSIARKMVNKNIANKLSGKPHHSTSTICQKLAELGALQPNWEDFVLDNPFNKSDKRI
jgi:hypothetical protein